LFGTGRRSCRGSLRAATLTDADIDPCRFRVQDSQVQQILLADIDDFRLVDKLRGADINLAKNILGTGKLFRRAGQQQ
jgi:hypothetical protein